MKARSFFVAIFSTLPFISSCANADISRNREAYILSQPHGWIELSLTDHAIPAQLPQKNDSQEQTDEYKQIPPICHLTVTLNNETFLSELIFPFGRQEPFSVNTGFRIPAPIGTFELDLIYSGCNIENEEVVSETFSTTIAIEEKMVTPVNYNGYSYTISPPEQNTVITLEDVYLKIK